MKDGRVILGLITLVSPSVTTLVAELLGLGPTEKGIAAAMVIVLFASIFVFYSKKEKSTTSRKTRPTRRAGFRAFLENGIRDDSPEGEITYLKGDTSILIVSKDSVGENEITQIKSQFAHKKDVIKVKEFLVKDENKKHEKANLKASLEGVNALIIIRSFSLEKSPWVYETIERWTINNSHIPCLVINRISDEEFQELESSRQGLSAIPDKYLHIYLDPVSAIPWRLLTRADERSLAWFGQARYNRKIALGTIFLLLSTLIFFSVEEAIQEKTEEHTVFHNKPAAIEIWNNETYHDFYWFNAQFANANSEHLNSHFELIQRGVKFNFLLIQPNELLVDDFDNFKGKFEGMRDFVEGIYQKMIVKSNGSKEVAMQKLEKAFEINIIKEAKIPSLSFFMTYSDTTKNESKRRAIVYFEEPELITPERRPVLSMETKDQEFIKWLWRRYDIANREGERKHISVTELIRSGELYPDSCFYVP